MTGLFILQNFTPIVSYSKNLPPRWKVFLLCAVLIFSLSGCRGETKLLPLNEPTRTITDDLGHAVRIPQQIERAVSLAPNLTEIVFAVEAGNKLVGRTSFDNFPLEARKIPTVGDTLNPNIENIIALKPQIVLVSTASQIETFSKQLEAQNIAVFVTNPNNLDGIYKTIYQTGEIFGKEVKAKEIVERLKQRVADVEARTETAENIKVFLQISKEPLFTIGNESFLTDLINRAGGVSVTANVATAYPKLSKETALALNPGAIILSDSEDNKEPNEVFKDSPAARNNKIFRIDADVISRPGPRIVDALEQIARDLHPESFQ